MIATLTLSSLAVGQDPPTFATIELAPVTDINVRRALWKKMRQLTEPIELTIPAGQSIYSIIVRRCGNAQPDLLEVVRELNPTLNLDALSQEQSITFFSCPYWRLDHSHAMINDVAEAERKQIDLPILIAVHKDELVIDVVIRALGIQADVPAVRKAIAEAKNPGVGSDSPNKAYRLVNEDTNAKEDDRLVDKSGIARADGVVEIPYIPATTTVQIRDALKTTPQSLVQELYAAAPEAMSGTLLQTNLTYAHNQYRIAEQSIPAELKAADCLEPERDLEHIVEWGKVQERFLLAYDVLKPKRGASTILIADTGLDVGGIGDDPLLWTNTTIAGGISATGYYRDVHGANILLSDGEIAPDKGYKFETHGTDVYDVLTSGLHRYPKLADHLQVASAKITTSRVPFEIATEAIGGAFGYAAKIPADVLNLSVVVNAPIPTLLQAIQSASFLVVAAAGNDNQAVELLNLYPPSLQSYREKLIVVGAHDALKHRAPFSNYGEIVDILAPGCSIPLTLSPKAPRQVSGTSFATPFISATAALLRALGISPSATKTRILATADFDPALAGLVQAAGTLNAPDALDIGRDILVVKESATEPPTKYHGKLKSDTWTCRAFPTARVIHGYDVLRVEGGFPSQAGDVRGWRVWSKTGDGDSTKLFCSTLSGKVTFTADELREAGVVATATYSWDMIVTLIPRQQTLDAH